MDKKAIANELADLGREEARLMRALTKVQARRCKLLSKVACHADAGLDAGTIAAASAPKDDGGE